MKRRRIFAFICGLAAFVLVALRLPSLSPGVAQENATLLVSAAASLQDALEAIDPLFEQANPTIRVNYNFASSGALQQQIEQGAPADVFFSAAQKQMDALQQKNLVLTDTRRNLLTNRLVLIVPRNSTLGLTSFYQLTGPNVKRVAVGDFRSVPVGQYSEELFSNLKILDPLRPKFVFGNNVRTVLSAVGSGNADAGLVYATDAKISDQVKQVATAPITTHSPIVYPIAVLRDSKNAQAARSYVQFLSDGQSGAIFQKFGFGKA